LTVRSTTDILGAVTAPPSALRAARGAQGWSQTEAARALVELARTRGVAVASPASLKTQLSRWENGHATPEAPYRALLAELYPESELQLGPADPDRADAPGPVERLRARLAVAAGVDAEVVALWRTQLATAQQLDHRLGAAGAAAAVRALLEQLETVLPHLPDPDRHRPVATLIARACLLAGAHALDEGDPDSASARFFRAAELARAAAVPDLAVEAAIGHAEALLDVGASRDALAVLEHAGVDVAHPPSGFPVELIAHRPDPAPPDEVEHLAAALARSRSTRERAMLHAELARALSTAGRGDEAAAEAREARMLATRIGSRRVLRRLDGQGLSAGSAVSSSASAAR
jgi:transcriptional regulator with XRE-family HTH domain